MPTMGNDCRRRGSLILHPTPPPPLPLTKGPLRFTVGEPSGVTSNTWRVWAACNGNVYVKCRDNFKEIKVSLHGKRWRMGMEEEAASKSSLLAPGTNRALEVWDAPSPDINGVIRAFQVQILASELAVRPEQRLGKLWRDSLFLKPPPVDRVLCVTLFFSPKGLSLMHESEPSLTLGVFALPHDRVLQVIAHFDPAFGYLESLRIAKARILMQYNESVKALPPDGYLYLHGRAPDGARFAMPAFAPTR